MPRRYSLGGPGTLVVGDPDPLEVALRRAQLEELLQKPQTERAQLALAQQEQALRGSTAASQRELGISQLQLDKQKAIEQGDLAKAQFLADKAYKEGSLQEDIRYHTGELGERAESRKSTAESAREATRSGVLRDLVGLYQPGETAGSVPAGTVGGLLEKSGYPELNQAYSEASGRRALGQAKAMLPEYQKYTPEQQRTELSAAPEEFQKAMTGLLNQPKEGEYGPPTAATSGTGAEPTGKKAALRMLDPNAPIFPPGESAASTFLPGLKKTIAPPGSGFEKLFGGATPAPAPTPAPVQPREEGSIFPGATILNKGIDAAKQLYDMIPGSTPASVPEATPGLPPNAQVILRRRRALQRLAPV